MCSTKVACGIVLYNPERDRLEQNLSAIISQVDYIILVDNGDTLPISSNWIENKKVRYIKNQRNRGIAQALNVIIRIACQKGYEWVLTLDQDSVCPSGMVRSYCKYIHIPNVAMIAPLIRDRNSESKVCALKDSYRYIDRCITSGTLTNTRAVIGVGGFDSRLFIDYVDFELCARLVEANYKIVQDCEVVMLHQYGNIREHKILGRTIRATNHSPARKYYQARNRIYCSKVYKKFFPLWKSIAYVISEEMKVVFFETDKMRKTAAIIRGIRDGINMN